MNVNEIRDRIVALSHQTAGDGEVQAKALGWLNAAYHELLEEVVAFLPPWLQVRLDGVTDASGMLALGNGACRVLKVVRASDGMVLDFAAPAGILEREAAGDVTPCYGVTAGGVRLYPAAAGVGLKVLYVPVVADLEEGGEEATVYLPREHHSALVWGGLVWSSLFERGFGAAAEMQLFQRQWLEAKMRVKAGLLQNFGGLRVASFDY